MDAEDYRNLVYRLEAEAYNQPAAFRRKVVLYSIGAYVVLFVLLALFAGATWWLVDHALDTRRAAAMLGAAGWLLIVAPALFLVLRMFLMRLEPPSGRRISADEAPRLFSTLEKLRRKLDAPLIHEVLVTPEFNAAIAQTPRFGLFGGHHNTLIVGLPYLYAMAPKEMLAVLAHEYGHLAGNHGKFGAWIYRQRRTLGALHEHALARAGDDMLNGLFARLLDTFAPYYNAHTFVLARQNEYEADRIAAELAGAAQAASGLVRAMLLNRWVAEDFWPRLYGQARDKAAPSFTPYAAMRRIFGVTMSEWATAERLRGVWGADSDVHDTHPCLRERVLALECRAELPPPVAASAAEVFLGERAHLLAREFDDRWWESEKGRWQEHHRRALRMGELERVAIDALSVFELQELASLQIDLRSPRHAKPTLEHLMARPGGPYSKPMYLYGRILLEEDEAAGLDHLARACLASPALEDDCLRAGYSWLLASRGEAEAERWAGDLSEQLERQRAEAAARRQ